MTKIEELLGILDIDPIYQPRELYKHIDYNPAEESFADLAFRLNDGKIGGRVPLGYIIDALILEMSK